MTREEVKITTPRLFLKHLCVADAPNVWKWASDDDVTRYLIFPTYTSLRDLEKWLESTLSSQTLFGICVDDGTLIGSIDCTFNEKVGKHSLGYCLRKDFWGKGYGTEAALALLGYVAEKFSAKDFCVSHALQNYASQRVIEKCGFVFDELGSYQKTDGSQTFPCKKYCLQINLHRMNLNEAPYKSIVSGKKTIELRLNDERRQSLAVGDFVALCCGNDKIVVKVLKLHKFESFKQLYSKLDLTKCGYSREELQKADWKDMLQYYPLEKQQKYGALGIEFQLLAAFSD